MVCGYNHPFTTKRAGIHRPFFLVDRLWSSTLPERVALRRFGSFVFLGLN